MADFSIFNADKLRRMNEITMTTRDAKLGDFLATVLGLLSNTDVAELNNGTDEKTEKVVPTVPESDATTIKQLVADYNDLLNALRLAGVIK